MRFRKEKKIGALVFIILVTCSVVVDRRIRLGKKDHQNFFTSDQELLAASGTTAFSEARDLGFFSEEVSKETAEPNSNRVLATEETSAVRDSKAESGAEVTVARFKKKDEELSCRQFLPPTFSRE
jgi:hypothetical protein